jgi:hypothetical protein
MRGSRANPQATKLARLIQSGYSINHPCTRRGLRLGNPLGGCGCRGGRYADGDYVVRAHDRRVAVRTEVSHVPVQPQIAHPLARRRRRASAPLARQAQAQAQHLSGERDVERLRSSVESHRGSGSVGQLLAPGLQPGAPFPPSIFRDKSRRDIGKSQSIWTNSEVETASSRDVDRCLRGRRRRGGVSIVGPDARGRHPGGVAPARVGPLVPAPHHDDSGRQLSNTRSR